jgi:hypothetical protein
MYKYQLYEGAPTLVTVIPEDIENKAAKRFEQTVQVDIIGGDVYVVYYHKHGDVNAPVCSITFSTMEWRVNVQL